MKQKIGNLALASIQPAPHVPQELSHHQNELAKTLQTTLEIDRLLLLFSEKIQTTLRHHGLEFKHSGSDVSVTVGKRAHHSCSYKMVIEDINYGELKLMRRDRFSQPEIARFEALLTYLAYPIRNAILYKQAVQSAHTDPLTQTLNRAALNDSLNREWQLAHRQSQPLSVILLDIDHFKAINDTFGHAQGDQVLKDVAACIKDTVRKSDVVFRYGGEEFVILLSNTPAQGAALLAQRLCDAVKLLKHDSVPTGLNISASFGVASMKPSDSNKDDLLARSDRAMYQAKHNGRDQVIISK